MEDATQFRITFEVDREDPALVFVPDFYRPNPAVLTGLAVNGYLPNGVKAASDDEFLTAVRRASTELREQRSKVQTWWYYFGCLPVSEAQISTVRSPAANR